MLPVLRFHSSTRQFYVWDSTTKRRVYLGSDQKAARDRYARWLADRGGPPTIPPPDRATVADVLEAYRRHADRKYTDRRERNRVGLSIAAVAGLCGNQPAGSFRAKALKDVRGQLLVDGKRPRSRRYVNKLVRSIQTAWRWLASEELVPAEAAVSVGLVRALSAGEGGRERPGVLPPAAGLVEATLPHCPPLVADMLRFQLLTGARPGEVCRMRGGEVSYDPTLPVPLAGTGRTVAAVYCGDAMVWMYAPGGHKTLLRGKARVVPIGPRAQGVVWRYLSGKRGSDVVFVTRRQTAYRADSYAKAVARACRKAGVPPWSPLQLRHAAATDLAERFDDHTAAAVLGHAAGSTATRVYVEQAVRKAAEAAAEMG
jgi:integrase